MIQWFKRRGPFGAAVLASLFTVLLMYSLPVLAAAGDNFILGQSNSSSDQTRLTGNTGLPNLKIKNTGNDPALRLETASGVPPMSVSSDKRVPNLNADKVDGINGANIMKKTVYDTDADGIADNSEQLGGRSLNQLRVRADTETTQTPPQSNGTILQVAIDAPGPGLLLMQGVIDTFFAASDNMACRLDRNGTDITTSDVEVDSNNANTEIPCVTMASAFVGAGTQTVSLEVAGFNDTNMDMDDSYLQALFIPGDLLILPLGEGAAVADAPEANE